MENYYGSVQGMDLKASQTNFDCEVCILKKMTKAPFPKKSERKSQLLEIIHSDLCGPMRVYSNGKARYCATFTYDYSRWCEIKFLKSKDEMLNAFNDFKAYAEKQTGKKIKILQSDNSSEYINNEFDKFLKANGIGRRLTVTYTPNRKYFREKEDFN